MSVFDVPKLISDVLDAIGEIAGEGWAEGSSLVQTQTKKLVTQAAMIAESRLSGTLKTDEEQYKHMLESLEERALLLAQTVAAITVATVQKVWNAVMEILRDAIGTVIDGAVPGPLLPGSSFVASG